MKKNLNNLSQAPPQCLDISPYYATSKIESVAFRSAFKGALLRKSHIMTLPLFFDITHLIKFVEIVICLDSILLWNDVIAYSVAKDLTNSMYVQYVRTVLCIGSMYCMCLVCEYYDCIYIL